jgi:hypothetical protein
MISGLGVMVFNAPFNNISVKSWRAAFLVEKNGVSGENLMLNLDFVNYDISNHFRGCDGHYRMLV